MEILDVKQESFTLSAQKIFEPTLCQKAFMVANFCAVKRPVKSSKEMNSKKSNALAGACRI